MTARKLALVLGGGGARGALQAGALRALCEEGVRPDLVVGASIGAMNAAFLGLHGCCGPAVDVLWRTWRDAAVADLLPSRYLWLTMRVLVRRNAGASQDRIRAFLSDHGLHADLRFAELPGTPVRLVAADLNSGSPVVFGADPQGLVQDAVIASGALPPWVYPLEQDGRMLVDGGLVSNLPIESALAAGASEILALDISEPRGLAGDELHLWNKLNITLHQRQLALEMALAEARGVPVRLIPLRVEQPVAVWDMSHAETLLRRGYMLGKKAGIGDRTPERSWD